MEYPFFSPKSILLKSIWMLSFGKLKEQIKWSLTWADTMEKR